MILRSLLTAAAMALSISTFANDAEAKTRVYIGIGSPLYYGECDYSLIFHNCYDRFGRYYGPPRYYYPRRYRERPIYDNRDYDRLSCGAARRLLRSNGYRNISVRDCNGSNYSFNATKNGRPYRVRMNALTGDFSRSRR